MDPSHEYCANKQQGLKPPQETTCLFRSEPENKLPNKQTHNQTNCNCFSSLFLCDSFSLFRSSIIIQYLSPFFYTSPFFSCSAVVLSLDRGPH